MQKSFDNTQFKDLIENMRDRFRTDEFFKKSFVLKIGWFKKNNLEKKIKSIGQGFIKWYFGLLGIGQDIQISAKDIVKSKDKLFYLHKDDVHKGLKCPYCGEGILGSFFFVCINSTNVNDIFVIEFLRCSNLDCNFISVETIDKLINKISVEKIKKAQKVSQRLIKTHQSAKVLDVVIEEKNILETQKQEAETKLSQLNDIIKQNSFSNILKMLLKEKSLQTIFSFLVLFLVLFLSLSSLFLGSNFKFSADISKMRLDVVNTNPVCEK